MKKALACILSLMLLSTALYGCGCSDRKTEPDMYSPQISPMPSPDTDNGIVNDDDGFIAEDEKEETAGAGSAAERKSDIEQSVLLSPEPEGIMEK